VSVSALVAATPYTAPLGLMDVLQVTILVLVAAAPRAWCSSATRSARSSR
jgi:hypothetical protein